MKKKRTSVQLAFLTALLGLSFVFMFSSNVHITEPVHAAGDLVAAYAFDEGTGTVAADVSGNSNNGTLVNGANWSATNKKYGAAALNLDGSNDRVNINDANSLDLTTGMTLEAWVRPNSTSGWRTVILKEVPGELAYGLYSRDPDHGGYPSGWIRFESTSGSSLYTEGAATLPNNTWSFLTTTFDGTNLKFFLNGVEVRSRPYSGSIQTSDSPLRIGGNVVWGEYFRGQIDEVRIYNRALSAAEITADMNTPVGAPDTTPPTVSMTAPADGATVAGNNITVSADASDNIGVVGVQFKLDGNTLGTEDTTAPYAIVWNSTLSSNGSHVLTATARDNAGNSAVSNPVNVTVNNPPQLVITSPTNGQVINGTTVPVTYTTAGDLTGSGANHVHFTLDNNQQVMDLSFDGVYQFNDVPAGNHTLNGYLAKADHSKVVGSDAVPVSFTTVTPDNEPPVVNITNPVNNSIVSGSLNITADATDNVGVVGVQFRIDGTNFGAEDTTAPYSVVWNTTLIANGQHTLTAIARDGAANTTTSTPVVVTVSNTNDPSQIGQWSAPVAGPIIAVHGTLMKNGKVVMWPNGAEVKVWDPATGNYTNAPNNRTNIFCNAHITMANGKVYAVGGGGPGPDTATRNTDFFDPVTQTWSAAGSMNIARWYPTATMLSDGRVLSTSGSNSCLTCYIQTPEIYNPITNTWTLMSTSANANIPMYPFMYVLPDGRVLQAGASEFATDTRVLNIGTQTWTTIDPTVRDGGSAVMYAPGKVMKSGSASDSGFTGSSSKTTFVLDMNQPSPAWRQTSDMAFARSFLNLTLLPDGTTLATGGDTTRDGFSATTAVKEAELWNSSTETWTTMASMQIPRLYHSIALLLPDGRVLVDGGGEDSGVPDSFETEIYSPPYLFKGARPSIVSAPSILTYGTSFFVETPENASIASVALIKNSAVTHSTNMDQRFMNLTFTQTTGGLMVNAPANSSIATPGVYMLFIVNSNGVPSIAPFVTLPSPLDDSQPPTAPMNLTAQGAIGSAALAWNAATDNVGVIAYNVHRSTTSGFIPSPSNKIGQTASLTYTDFTSAGTYYYLVTAQDAAGNISPASNEASAVVTSDTTPPTVNITSPANNATVSSVINVTADATDDVAVAGVQFKLDGANLGAEDTSAPYSVSWDTNTASNAVHELTAVARDAAGNSTTSSVISVTVFNDITLAIHSSTPARVQGIDPITTAAFNPPDNSLLLVMISSDAAGNNDPALSITNNGTPLTWNLIAERSKNDAGAQDGEASAFYALLPTGRTGMTVTATITDQNLNFSMKVYVVTGHNTTTPIGAIGEGSSTTNNITPTIYTSTVANSLGFGVASDWNATGLPTSTDQEDAFHIAGWVSGLSAYKGSVTSSVGTPVTINIDAAGTGATALNWVGFEVKPQ